MRATSLVSLIRQGAAGRRWHTTVGPSFEYRQRLPEDPTPRKTCTHCGFVNYENPKVVCGSVLTVKGEDGSGANDLIVLGKRSIQPRQGYWGIPAGFLEMGESTEEGAAREAREELNADVQLGDLLAVYSLPHINIIQMIYTSVLKDAEDVDSNSASRGVSAGQETDEVAFFRWEDVPWDSLAFPTTSWALWHHHQRSEYFRSESLRSESVGFFRSESLRSESVGSESLRSGDKSEPLQAELAGGRGEDVAGGTEQEAGGRDNLRSDSGLGDGTRSGSSRAVFSAPTTISAQFWCPKRGLHIKDDWNISADS